MKPFTITTFFPTGNPDGVRIASASTKSISAFYIPRADIKWTVDQRKELAWNGVYTLFNQVDGGGKRTAYIGEAENVGHRLTQHNVEKENWWELAVAFVINNEDHQLTKADIKFLENLMYERARKGDAMALYNGNTPHKSFVAEGRKYDLAEIFENIDLLLRSFDLPLFESSKRQTCTLLTTPAESTLSRVKPALLIHATEKSFYFTGRQSNATGVYQDGKMVVKAGSQLTAKPASKTFNDEQRLKQLEKSGVIKDNVFTQDYTFNSPSTAGTIIYKARCNGWTMWHDANGKTLNDVYRQN